MRKATQHALKEFPDHRFKRKVDREFKRGMQTLIDALESRLRNAGVLVVQDHVRSLQRDSSEWQVVLGNQSIRADGVVLGVPASTAATYV